MKILNYLISWKLAFGIQIRCLVGSWTRIWNRSRIVSLSFPLFWTSFCYYEIENKWNLMEPKTQDLIFMCTNPWPSSTVQWGTPIDYTSKSCWKLLHKNHSTSPLSWQGLWRMNVLLVGQWNWVSILNSLRKVTFSFFGWRPPKVAYSSEYVYDDEES